MGVPSERSVLGRRDVAARQASPYDEAMPELPEVEITARRLDEALRGAEIVSVLAPGVKAMRTFDPPLSALEGQRMERVGRRGKHFSWRATGRPLVLLIHLMSAGRLQLYDRRAGPRDRTSRLLVRVLLGGEEAALIEGGAAPARVRLQAGRLGQALASRGAGAGRVARDARPGGVAGAAAACRAARRGASASHGAARPARHCRYRPLMGG